ncbi:sensor histidine kinase [Anaerococcus hydrogenalis]|uniref:sensor histidine kinase n=1 Tax=Anaerococcus hydrogenalis TaxID=33029 RepID=UPI00288C08AC|nr:HAMP domain-containing sensor histidine kinase [Anaerococcus hydrogenalis]
MKNLKLFPQIFISTFSIFLTLIILIHLAIYLIFPWMYFDSRREGLVKVADKISTNLQGKDLDFVKDDLEIISDSFPIEASFMKVDKLKDIKIDEDPRIDFNSYNNSLIIEERDVKLNNNENIRIKFILTVDLKKEGKEMSLSFLPLTLFVSLISSALISFFHAKKICKNINQIKDALKRMMDLDRDACLEIDSKDEVGELKSYVNVMYESLLDSIDSLAEKNKEIIRLEKLKYDFFKGVGHELKTPLASLKIILENMKYKVGKYKDRDTYIDKSLELTDHLSENISFLLAISTIKDFKNDEENLYIGNILEETIEKYKIMANEKKIKIENYIKDEKIYIGKNALKMVLSNLISNAIKYSKMNSQIEIGSRNFYFYIRNTMEKDFDIEKIKNINFDINKENSKGLGLYIVRNILKNYEIPYKIKKNEEELIFYIKIFDK